MDSYPVRAVITAKEKRYKPVKHYVFIVEVKWSDGSKIPIYRQYSDFAQLHSKLTDIVASHNESKGENIKLPDFPHNKIFQRNEVRKMASVRRHAFDDYCQGLFQLDKYISQHSKTIEFFKSRYDDINPKTEDSSKNNSSKRSSLFAALSGLLPGSRKSEDLESKSSLSRSTGNLDVIPEDDPIYVSSPIVCETYVVLADYIPQEKSEIKLKEGMTVEVVEKYDNGWWFVQTEYGFGWAAATYLTPLDAHEEEPEPIYSGQKYISTNAFTGEDDDEVSFTDGVLVKVLHKLLDGWWIVDYQGKVGYAPATYLAPFNNPHYRDSRYGFTRGGRPTKRRTTIMNSKGRSLKQRKHRDLSVYKKISTKISQADAKIIADKLNTIENNNTTVKIVLPEDELEDKTEGQKRETEGKINPDILRKRENNKREDSHSYEYIDEDDMDLEEVDEWVVQKNQDILKNRRASEPPLLPLRVPDNITYNKAPKSPITDKRNTLPEGMVFQKAPVPPGGKAFNKPPSPPSGKSSPVPAAPGMTYVKPPTPLYSKANKVSQIIIDEEHAECFSGSDHDDSRTDQLEQETSVNKEMLQEQGTSATSNDSNKGTTGQEAMQILISSLRNKSIHSVRTNEKGELVIKFDGSDGENV